VSAVAPPPLLADATGAVVVEAREEVDVVDVGRVVVVVVVVVVRGGRVVAVVVGGAVVVVVVVGSGPGSGAAVVVVVSSGGGDVVVVSGACVVVVAGASVVLVGQPPLLGLHDSARAAGGPARSAANVTAAAAAAMRRGERATFIRRRTERLAIAPFGDIFDSTAAAPPGRYRPGREDADARPPGAPLRARDPRRLHRAGAPGTAVTAVARERPHLTGLDGVRGLALALVIAHHVVVRDRSPIINGGWVGVDLFFVLSGYLITRSMLERRDLGDFLRRRFWRIAPAMVVLLAVYAVARAGDPHAGSWALAATFQWSNVQGAIGPPFSPHLGHLWSLSAEVQFYVAWGVCLWLLLRARVSRAAILGGLAAAFVVTAVERAALWESGTPWNRLYLGPDTRAAALLVGCALAVAHASGWLRPTPALGALVLPAVAFMTWFVLALSFLDGRVYVWGFTVASLAWGVVVAATALRAPTPLVPLVECRPLVWLGRISYSVYLWHLPVIAEVAEHRPDDPIGVAVIAVPLSLLIGWVSYVLVERPLLSSAGRARLFARIA
jgi:peptidoglycan/LPS O-acetylase OafA/YrhL